MTAEALLDYTAQVGFLTIFLVVLARAFRRPTAANFYAAAFFGLAAATVTVEWIAAGVDSDHVFFAVLQTALLLAWPYPLLRLAHEFIGVPTLALRLAEGTMAGGLLATFVGGGDFENGLVALVLLVYFVGTVAYASTRFVRGARRHRGFPRRRMVAAATGSAFIALLVLTAIPAGINPSGPWSSLATLCGLASGIAYFVAFAPPVWLRTAWVSSDLQQFIVDSILEAPLEPGAGDETAHILETNTTRVMGARAVLLVENADTGFLKPADSRSTWHPPSPASTVSFRCYRSQRPMFQVAPGRTDPANAEAYREVGAAAILAAPVTLQEERYGVLLLLVERPPMFAEADLQLLQLLADQAAVVLRDRNLLNEAAEAAAQQEALRLKEDFLSAAAHDLKTPLTTLLAQSQLMQRFAIRNPDTPADREGIDRLVTEAQRMRRLVSDLLDASRSDQTGFVGVKRPVDLLLLAQETTRSMGPRAQRVVVDGESCVATVDRDRIAQVLENLLDNALKYSPGGGTVRVDVQADGDVACIKVVDSGVGIPQRDLGTIFERFRRGASVDERRFSGLGLGLYLCRRIVEEHGGAISVASNQGEGSTFSFRLPVADRGGEAING